MAEKPALILVVDDEKDFLEIVSVKLNSAGFDVVQALGGEQALARLKEFKPDLILLDLKMPGMDGAEVLSKIKADSATSDVKVVFLTNFGEPLPVKELLEVDRRFAKEAGAFDYIKKTDDLDEIVKRVKTILTKTNS